MIGIPPSANWRMKLFTGPRGMSPARFDREPNRNHEKANAEHIQDGSRMAKDAFVGVANRTWGVHHS